MSIDNRIWVPAGARNDSDIRYTKYKCDEVMPSEQYTGHQVFMALGANVLIDEQYFFQTEEDARWFWEVGHQESLARSEELEVCGYDRMCLWIDRTHEAER